MELMKQRSVDAQRIEWAKKAEAFFLWTAALKDYIERPLLCKSIEDVDQQMAALDQKMAEVESKRGDLAALANENSATQADGQKNPYARFTVDDLNGFLQVCD